MNLKTTHTFPIKPQTFWDHLYFDKEYNQKLYEEQIRAKQYEVLEYSDSEHGITRKVKIVPEQKAPVVIQKLISGEFSYVEEGTFDRKEGIYRFKITPSVKSDKIKISGKVTAEPREDGSILRTIDMDLKADIFAIGGQIEKFVGEQIQKGYEASYQFTLNWIRKHNLK
jgi:hypothetical protein